MRRAFEVRRVAVRGRQESAFAMFGEDGVRPALVAEVADAEAIVRHERLQRDRAIGEEGARLKLTAERLRDGLETDEELRFRRRRPEVCHTRLHPAPRAVFYP